MGHKRSAQSTVKSPPARSSSQTPTGVPVQSALQAIQSHQPSRVIELAFAVGDIFQVKGDYVQPDGSIWLDVMSPVSGMRGIVPFPKFRIISFPYQSSSESPNPSQPTPQSPPSPQSDEKFLHSRSLQRIRKRLSASAHTPLYPLPPLKPSPSTPEEEEEPDDNIQPEPIPFPSADPFCPEASPSRNRRSSTLSSSKPTNSSISSCHSRMRFLSQAYPANMPTYKPKPPAQLKASRQKSSPVPPHSPERIKSPTRPNPPSGQAKSPQLLCGVVKYPFTAETDHELDAKAGEAIIINAYSDLGWFVCKPISRLGGPGLLPVSHVEIRDVSTGMEVSPENVEDFVRAAGLPRVNEWEEAAAAYLGRSIPLGTLGETGDTPTAPPPPQALPTVTLSEPSKPISMNVPSAPSDAEVMASSELVREWQRRQMEQDTLFVEPPTPTPCRESNCNPIDQLRVNHGTFIGGIAESLAEAQGQFWFTLQVKFACPNDIKTLVLYRSYEDLVEFDRCFQSQLKTISEDDAEIFQMPWLMEHVSATYMADKHFCAYQVDELTSYLEQLSQASIEIRELREVYDLLGPRHGDLELDENPLGNAENDILEYMNKMALTPSKDDLLAQPPKPSPSASQFTSADQSITSSALDTMVLQHHYSDPSLGYSSSTPSSLPSAMIQPCPSPLPKPPAKSYYHCDGQFTKIKICDLQSDDFIAIKARSSIPLSELTEKIYNRFHETVWSSGQPDDDCTSGRVICLKYFRIETLEQSCIDFEDYDSSADECDEVPPHLGRGKFVKIKSDAQLLDWMNTEKKLVLYI
ncbi:hypothetical protein PCANC_00017 [Puccinia coronata f. sp. avenae]|uniref:SH3 domain-containing protein n=1 Tax=Puccinia coronata f. sp. avenae TaxID=200324 RepID=A0A2N5W8Q7_9BASI|nr:hypothetical protein PCANC_00017 [Puccinia coronata f. sp. avenae]